MGLALEVVAAWTLLNSRYVGVTVYTVRAATCLILRTKAGDGAAMSSVIWLLLTVGLVALDLVRPSDFPYQIGLLLNFGLFHRFPDYQIGRTTRTPVGLDAYCGLQCACCFGLAVLIGTRA